jgi:DNA anti-recombination protein RmuC
MGLGGTAKKLQKVASMAEDLYGRMNDVVAQVQDLQSDLERTSDQVDDLERRIAEQRAIIEALADQQGIDVDEALASVGTADEPTADDAAADGADETGASDATAEAEPAAQGGE